MSEDQEALAQTVALELRLLDPGTRRCRREVEKLLHASFREIGASRVWDRESVLAELAANPGDGARVSELSAERVCEGAVLITYVATVAGEGASWRSSLWVHGEDAWRILFHQGTPFRA